MTKKRVAKKPKTIWVGTTRVTRITPEERKKLHKLMKKRLALRRKKCPEVRGKLVDYITHCKAGADSRCSDRATTVQKRCVSYLVARSE